MSSIYSIVVRPDEPHLMVGSTSVPAGYPSPAQDYFSGTINLSDHLIHDPVSTFIVRVSGSSMEGAGISDGDELVVNRAKKPIDGSVVIAVLDGEMTVKFLHFTKSGVTLRAANPDYPDIQISELADLQIWAVAEYCIHKL